MQIIDPFNYINDNDGSRHMHAEGVSLNFLATKAGTPLYVYSYQALTERYNTLKKVLPDSLICYSVKANGNISIVNSLAQLGAGADVVSGGELQRAITAGVETKKIVFSGVGKTELEMAAALSANILQINIESEPELELLNKISLEKGVIAPVAVRVNPDVDANTHDKISTGRQEDKFGIPYKDAIYLYSKIKELKGLESVGLATHIGSQLISLEPFRKAFKKLTQLALTLKTSGHNIRSLDFGGGLGINYSGELEPNINDYAKIIKAAGDEAGCQVILEPGRFIAGPSGILLTRVIYVKRTEARTFAIVDCAMNDFMRPTLYNAWHKVELVSQQKNKVDTETVDIVGPICESGDFIAKDRDLPPLSSGTLLSIKDAGAYGASMSSYYNSRLPAGEVIVSGNEWDIIKKRQSLEDLIGLENFAHWQKKSVKEQ